MQLWSITTKRLMGPFILLILHILTESQEYNTEILVEMMNDDAGQLPVNYTESSEEWVETWLPSSGFSVRKDINNAEV